jgi:hypothetical protein
MPDTVAVDQTPVWTPDGAAVVFARTVYTEAAAETTILYRLDGPGAEPDPVAPVGLFPFATYYGMAYAPTGG